jgi:hypothetical protein
MKKLIEFLDCATFIVILLALLWSLKYAHVIDQFLISLK